ncbi:uncharacterized protein NFIA_012530 [Aspergillus fischeri NRRL 181]|uniref:Uncharacterized protein n=1 Tax=Neosartorya fischeri (strain ATCC 1020 / DSM 3700 / CBS 544.65 / FGSC A1164 / JCM 1740 / NRRL 181 / WB 181) TaxID=331117 RepID=A1D2C1_NEOFI|nr:uncharacterized protein NFIA_012530 [Aspergillus fischeri NRRL 181]EAW22564.1 predicted protein [Aspergillus fischeri NRRL 181]
MAPPMSPRPPTNSRTRSLRSASVEASPRSSQQIFNEIVYKIPKIKEFTELIYEDINSEDGSLLCQSLIMLTELHDVHQRWAISSIVPWYARGLINLQENELLGSGAGTTFTGFAGRYQGSHKEPDFFFRADSLPFPSIVIEAGWSESFPHLRNDKDLWMHGCASVELVILLRWTKISGNRIKGTLEVWRRNGAGGLSVTEMVSILQSQVYDRKLILKGLANISSSGSSARK